MEVWWNLFAAFKLTGLTRLPLILVELRLLVVLAGLLWLNCSTDVGSSNIRTNITQPRYGLAFAEKTCPWLACECVVRGVHRLRT